MHSVYLVTVWRANANYDLGSWVGGEAPLKKFVQVVNKFNVCVVMPWVGLNEYDVFV